MTDYGFYEPRTGVDKLMISYLFQNRIYRIIYIIQYTIILKIW